MNRITEVLVVGCITVHFLPDIKLVGLDFFWFCTFFSNLPSLHKYLQFYIMIMGFLNLFQRNRASPPNGNRYILLAASDQDERIRKKHEKQIKHDSRDHR